MKTIFKKTAALTAAVSVLLCGCSVSDIRNVFQDDSAYHKGNINDDKPSATSSLASEKPDKTDPPEPAPSENGDTAKIFYDGTKGTILSLSADDSLTISRLGKREETVTGDKGVWTVFVYLCGTDLESNGGNATSDLQEMIDATADCGSLRFVVETDGTGKWQNTVCKGKTKQRFLIARGGIEEVYSGKSTNMGLSSTLADFVSWGAENYQSEYMVLDLWNHGGGSINGICFDENFYGDSLELKEIDEALASAFGKMSQKFELIGCDACLMATVETANIFAPYGRYAVFSQNLESGFGWDYRSFADAVNGGASHGGEMGKYIADGYYSYCAETGVSDEATMSVIDLSRLDSFLFAFNKYAKDIYESCQADCTQFIRAAKNALSFGSDSSTKTYANMVDVGELITYSSDISSNAAKAFSALEECVYYRKNSSLYSNACGLCMYYPLSLQGSMELKIFKDICTSPFYLSTVDACAYVSDSSGNSSGYEDNIFSDYWNDSDLSGDYNYWEDDNDDNSLNFDENNCAISFDVKPHLDSDGNYTFALTQDSLYLTESVYCNIAWSYFDEDDNKEYMLDLGTDDYVDMDWDKGECRDNFDGSWFCLPDGQPISVYLIGSKVIDSQSYCNIYTSPIYLNGEYTNLKIKQTYKLSGDYYTTVSTDIIGAWEGIDENGSAAKEVYLLQRGDTIQPCYYAYDASTYEYAGDYYGDEYTYTGSGSIIMDYLYDGDYYYAYEINDYFGNTLYTDFVLFGLENGELYYYYD